MNEMTPFEDWINIDNVNHLGAINYLVQYGSWPRWFFAAMGADNVDTKNSVTKVFTEIFPKIAKRYIEEKLDEVEGYS